MQGILTALAWIVFIIGMTVWMGAQGITVTAFKNAVLAPTFAKEQGAPRVSLEGTVVIDDGGNPTAYLMYETERGLRSIVLHFGEGPGCRVRAGDYPCVGTTGYTLPVEGGERIAVVGYQLDQRIVVEEFTRLN